LWKYVQNTWGVDLRTLGISGLDPRGLEFSTPKKPPEIKKKLEKKKVIKTAPKKGTSTAFCAGPLMPKKKVGVKQGKFTQVIFGSAGFAPPNQLPKKSPPDPVHSLSPHAFLLGLFLTRVSQVRIWVPIN
jgi:hypothetical protein